MPWISDKGLQFLPLAFNLRQSLQSKLILKVLYFGCGFSSSDWCSFPTMYNLKLQHQYNECWIVCYPSELEFAVGRMCYSLFHVRCILRFFSMGYCNVIVACWCDRIHALLAVESRWDHCVIYVQCWQWSHFLGHCAIAYVQCVQGSRRGHCVLAYVHFGQGSHFLGHCAIAYVQCAEGSLVGPLRDSICAVLPRESRWAIAFDLPRRLIPMLELIVCIA
jgi:hypothetical protein